MANGRERMMLLVVGAFIALLCIDYIIVEPYFVWRDQLQSQHASDEHAIGEDRELLAQKQRMMVKQASLLSRLPSDSAVAENQLLHQLHQWEMSAGVHGASFQRMQRHPDSGFDLLTYHITANGPIAPIAELLFHLETAKMPLRVDEVHLSPRRSGDEAVELQANISTICTLNNAGNKVGGNAGSNSGSTANGGEDDHLARAR